VAGGSAAHAPGRAHAAIMASSNDKRGTLMARPRKHGKSARKTILPRRKPCKSRAAWRRRPRVPRAHATVPRSELRPRLGEVRWPAAVPGEESVTRPGETRRAHGSPPGGIRAGARRRGPVRRRRPRAVLRGQSCGASHAGAGTRPAAAVHPLPAGRHRGSAGRGCCAGCRRGRTPAQAHGGGRREHRACAGDGAPMINPGTCGCARVALKRLGHGQGLQRAACRSGRRWLSLPPAGSAA
jgi:hypothetical protein